MLVLHHRPGIHETPLDRLNPWKLSSARSDPGEQTPAPDQIDKYLPVRSVAPDDQQSLGRANGSDPTPGHTTRSFMMPCKPVEWVYGPGAASGDRVPVAR